MSPQEFLDVIDKQPEAEAIRAVKAEPSLAGSASDDEGPLQGATALHWAAHRNYADLTQMLIDLGAEVDASDCKWGNHSTPLQWAADAGMAEGCRVLLRNGAAIDYHEGNGHTALHCCAWGGSSGGARDPDGYAETARVLLDAGFVQDGPGRCVSALTMALHVKNGSVARVLEEAGATHAYGDPGIRERMRQW